MNSGRIMNLLVTIPAERVGEYILERTSFVFLEARIIFAFCREKIENP